MDTRSDDELKEEKALFDRGLFLTKNKKLMFRPGVKVTNSDGREYTVNDDGSIKRLTPKHTKHTRRTVYPPPKP